MNRRTGITTALAAALLVLPATAAQTAQAGTTTRGTSPMASVHTGTRAASTDYVAAWQHINRGQPRCTISAANPRWSQICGNINDWASSLWSASRTRTMAFYFDANYSGAYICLPPTASMDNLTQLRFNRGRGNGLGQIVNDRISSNRWVSSC